MVNTSTPSRSKPSPPALPVTGILVRVYLVVVLGTLAALVVLAVVAPPFATTDAWGHAIVVAVFAVVLPLRLRTARRGRRGAVRAVGLIAAVLFLVNITEALIPGFVPGWVRVQMIVVALLTAGIVLEVVRWAVVHKD